MKDQLTKRYSKPFVEQHLFFHQELLNSNHFPSSQLLLNVRILQLVEEVEYQLKRSRILISHFALTFRMKDRMPSFQQLAA
jgi:hypothetical protein